LGAFNIRHSGLDPESRLYFWIPAFAGMTTLIYENIFATFGSSLCDRLSRGVYVPIPKSGDIFFLPTSSSISPSVGRR
jgi:hypothetical protein